MREEQKLQTDNHFLIFFPTFLKLIPRYPSCLSPSSSALSVAVHEVSGAVYGTGSHLLRFVIAAPPPLVCTQVAVQARRPLRLPSGGVASLDGLTAGVVGGAVLTLVWCQTLCCPLPSLSPLLYPGNGFHPMATANITICQWAADRCFSLTLRIKHLKS